MKREYKVECLVGQPKVNYRETCSQKATFNFTHIPLPEMFKNPSYLAGLVVMGLIAWSLIGIPLKNAGRPDEPAPPVAIM